MVAPTRSVSTALSARGMRVLRQGAMRLQTLVYPPRCLLCSSNKNLRDGMDACTGCLAEMPRMHHPCVSCAASLVNNAGSADLCGRCLSHPPPFARTRCLGPYEGGIAALITGLKYSGRLENARLLGQLVGHYMRAHPDCRRLSLLPVPLHPARLRGRGFNQALEIGKWVARTAGIEIIKGLVRRQRNTPAQTGLSARGRRSNVANAFVCSRRPVATRIALLDDVMTTGSTVASLAATLRGAGCEHVEVWCCARASLHAQQRAANRIDKKRPDGREPPGLA